MQDKKDQLEILEKELSIATKEEANSWVGRGIGYYKITQLIDPNNDKSSEWKKLTGYPSFSQYVMGKWKDKNPHRAIRQRIAAKNLMENKPELLEEYKSKRCTFIPGFTVLCKLDSMKHGIDNDDLNSLVEEVYSGKIARIELEDMARENLESNKSKKTKKITNSKKPYVSPYYYSDERLDEEEFRDVYIERESFLIKVIPKFKDKMNELYPGVQGDNLRELITQIEDECRSINYNVEAA